MVQTELDTLELQDASQTHDLVDIPEDERNGLYARMRQLESTVNGQQDLMLQCLSMLTRMSDAVDASQGIGATSITSITANDVEIPLRIPMVAIIEEDEDEVGARIPEFSASGFGSTESEAIAELKAELGDLYAELMDTPDELIGALPKRWKQGLANLVMLNGE